MSILSAGSDFADECTDALCGTITDRVKAIDNVASAIRQALVDVMAGVEQSGIDAALDSAIEAFDRKCEQEGITIIRPENLPEGL